MAELRVPAKIENLEKVAAFFEESIGKENCDRMEVAILHVVVEEVFVNIASYAYVPDEGDAVIRIAVHRDPMELELEFRDCGRPFNPLGWKEPVIPRNVAERQIGGLGLFLVKRIMDQVQYTYTSGMNVLNMKKAIGFRPVESLQRTCPAGCTRGHRTPDTRENPETKRAAPEAGETEQIKHG